MCPTTTTKTTKKNTRSKSLVIVESPTKARTLTRYLGKDFSILASGGHIADLPKKNLGVDIENDFEPKYSMLPGKSSTVKKLKQAAEKAGAVFLASDPDREGEAIAFHIARYLAKASGNSVYRIQFHEITRSAVESAIEQAGEVDLKKVDAWKARRVMDRLVGYQVSPLLWKTVTGGLSAGRVQSVALRIICEREEEISVFNPVEYWTIDGLFSGENVDEFKAKLVKVSGQKAEIPDVETSDTLVEGIGNAQFSITNVERKRRKRQPYAPFTTSTLQQDAGRRLGFTVKRTMSNAQRLYEGIELGERGQIGLITYMRTDSLRIAEEAVVSLRDWISSNIDPSYLTEKPRYFKNKKSSIQDAHEAIRPTDVNLKPEDLKSHLSTDEFKLYDLIWRRFTATQMKPAEFDTTKVYISGDKYEFQATGQVLVFDGFLKVYQDNAKREDENALPAGLEPNLPLNLIEIDPQQHFTQPPPRYNESSLVKTLDELGIGRPSTYASIITTLIDRNYVEREKKSFVPTDLGKTVKKILINNFPDIFNVKFTAKMEEELDLIETGDSWQKVVRDFYVPFSSALKTAEERRGELKKSTMEPVGRACPECGEDLVYRWSKRGRFISCSGFPSCKYAESLTKDEPQEVEDVKCPKCGSNMMLRNGRFGKFYGCSDYPKCKGILPFTTGHKCPREGCDGEISERKSKKGRVFFGCTNYPECKLTTWDAPVKGPCPNCQAATVFDKVLKTKPSYRYCAVCDWKGDISDE